MGTGGSERAREKGELKTLKRLLKTAAAFCIRIPQRHVRVCAGCERCGCDRSRLFVDECSDLISMRTYFVVSERSRKLLLQLYGKLGPGEPWLGLARLALMRMPAYELAFICNSYTLAYLLTQNIHASPQHHTMRGWLASGRGIRSALGFFYGFFLVSRASSARAEARV